MMKITTLMNDMIRGMILKTTTTLWLPPHSTKKPLGLKGLGTTTGGRSRMAPNIYTLTLTGGLRTKLIQCFKPSRGVTGSPKEQNSKSLWTTPLNGIQKLTLTSMTSKAVWQNLLSKISSWFQRWMAQETRPLTISCSSSERGTKMNLSWTSNSHYRFTKVLV